MDQQDCLTLVIKRAEDENERLDKFIASHTPSLSRSAVQRLLKGDDITVNGEPRKPSYAVQLNDRIQIYLPPPEPTHVIPQDIPLNIIYEDVWLLVVNKPAGMVVHPGAGHPNGTLVNAVLAHCPQVAQVGRPERAGIVHRLDKDTSGLLLIAKDEETQHTLQRQFKRRQVKKSYRALVEGQVQPPDGVIEVPIGRDRRDRKKMAVVRGGRRARTVYHTAERFVEHTLLDVQPYTGRTHQVRVHLAWLGYPIVGDEVYGHRHQPVLKHRHFLHAAELALTHPATGEGLSLKAPLPTDLAQVLKHLRSD